MMRLDKYLSESSSYSRRDVRLLVKSGKITVNGTVAETPDQKVETTDVIAVKGEVIRHQKYVYLMLNKPAGYISATWDKKDPVVVDLLPESFRHFEPFPVGRLDKDTVGLLLLTNDGRFDHALMSPRKHMVKRYYAELSSPAEEQDAVIFSSGIKFKEFTALPAKLEITSDPRKVYIELREGKFHQVKRMCEHVGKEVLFLKRVAIGDLLLDETLQPGECRELTPDEMALLGQQDLLCLPS